MDFLKNHEILLGTNTGSLIYLKQNNEQKIIKTAEHSQKSSSITSLSWGRTPFEVILGFSNGDLKIYYVDTDRHLFLNGVEDFKIIGITTFNNTIFSFNENGHICDETMKEHAQINVGKGLIKKVVPSPRSSINVGLGGFDFDVKIFDIDNKKYIFQGKGDRHDELELARATTLNSLVMLPDDWSFDIASVTAQGQIRIYDTRVQRRPVKDLMNEKHSYVSVAHTKSNHQIVVGSTKGYLSLIDVRNTVRPITSFKQFMGSVTDIYCDHEEDKAAAVSLDRYFRLYDIKEKKLELEKYMKVQLTQILVSRMDTIVDSVDSEDDIVTYLPLKRKNSDDELPLQSSTVKKNKSSKKKSNNFCNL